MHLQRNRDREVENVIHKHSLRGREAENVNALKLHQTIETVTLSA